MDSVLEPSLEFLMDFYDMDLKLAVVICIMDVNQIVISTFVFLLEFTEHTLANTVFVYYRLLKTYEMN